MHTRTHATQGIARRRFIERSLATGAAAALWPQQSLVAQAPQKQTEITNDVIRRSMTQAPLSMLFRGQTADDCRTWQESFRKQLSQLLGDSTPPKTWKTVVENRTVFEDHVRHQLLLTCEGVPALPVYLLVPRGLKTGQRAPGVLCVHGHGSHGYDPIVGRTDLQGVSENIKKNNYDYGLQFVRRGYVVAAPCMTPFGRRVDRARYGGNDPCAVTFVRMQALGRLPITANLRDLRWSIDLLQSQDQVDGDRIGCAGLSYGGRMTMMVSAMDQRIRVASVSGALNLLQERMTLRHSCGSQMIPNLLKYGDYSEIGSLIAPRPCVWETGSTDSLIVPKWDEVFRNRLRRAYTAWDASDQLHFDKFIGGHVWSGRIAFPLFDKVLKS